MDYTIRKIREEEYPLLNNFLYEAIFIPEGIEAPLKSIINTPELQVYISDFGTQKHDRALIAEVRGKADCTSSPPFCREFRLNNKRKNPIY